MIGSVSGIKKGVTIKLLENDPPAPYYFGADGKLYRDGKVVKGRKICVKEFFGQ